MPAAQWPRLRRHRSYNQPRLWAIPAASARLLAQVQLEPSILAQRDQQNRALLDTIISCHWLPSSP